ncbi:secreted protein, partial [gut metagenome]
MKKIFGALLCAGALTACQGNDANVSGTLDVNADTLLVYFSASGRDFKVDTVQLNNKQFSVQLPDTALNQVFLFAMKDGMTNRSEKVELLLLPGKKV